MDQQAGERFGHSLRRELAASGLSQRQVAHKCGVDHTTISRLAHGQRMPKLDTATKLARVFPELAQTWERKWDGSSPGTSRGEPSRVEHALRRDGSLTAPDVREVMGLYLLIRSKRLREPLGLLQTPTSHVASEAPRPPIDDPAVRRVRP